MGKTMNESLTFQMTNLHKNIFILLTIHIMIYFSNISNILFSYNLIIGQNCTNQVSLLRMTPTPTAGDVNLGWRQQGVWGYKAPWFRGRVVVHLICHPAEELLAEYRVPELQHRLKPTWSLCSSPCCWSFICSHHRSDLPPPSSPAGLYSLYYIYILLQVTSLSRLISRVARKLFSKIQTGATLTGGSN